MTTATSATPTILLVKTYFVKGTQPKGWRNQFVIQDPPTSGYGHAVMIKGEKRSTLLCPFTLVAHQVPNSCGEMHQAVGVPIADERLAAVLTDSWQAVSALGLQRDFAVAAMVLTQLGAPVPKMAVLAPSEFSGQREEDAQPKVQGGKPIDLSALCVVNPNSKRGAVAKFFAADTPQSLHEAMARLGLTRSGVLSHLFCLARGHGVGYVLQNDCATLLIPEGFDLFAYVEPEKKAPVVPVDDDGQPREVKKRSSGKAINTEALAPIPEPGKRANVARLFVAGFYSIEKAMTQLELNRSAVLSHLFTINKENGLGYEMNEDSTQARLLVPEGHTVFAPKQPRVKRED